MLRRSLLSAFLGLVGFAISGHAARADQAAGGPASPASLQVSASANFPAYVVYYKLHPNGHWIPSPAMSYDRALRMYWNFTRQGVPAYIRQVN